MPRSVKRETKIKWTQLFDGGLSVAEIRNQEKRKPDPRTIQRAIDEVQAGRRKEQVRGAALLEGLKDHLRTLLAALDHVPGKSFDWTGFSPAPVYALDRNEIRGAGWTARRQSGKWLVALSFESSLESRLLIEHIPSDQFWTLLSSFKEALGEAVSARLGFARTLSETLSSETGLPVIGSGSQPGLVRAGLSRLDQQVVGQALEDHMPDLHLRREKDGLWAGDALLVHDEGLPDEEKVITCLESVAGSDAWRRLLGASGTLNRSLEDLAEERDIMKLGAYLPGECRACARYIG